MMWRPERGCFLPQRFQHPIQRRHTRCCLEQHRIHIVTGLEHGAATLGKALMIQAKHALKERGIHGSQPRLQRIGRQRGAIQIRQAAITLSLSCKCLAPGRARQLRAQYQIAARVKNTHGRVEGNTKEQIMKGLPQRGFAGFIGPEHQVKIARFKIQRLISKAAIAAQLDGIDTRAHVKPLFPDGPARPQQHLAVSFR